MTSNNYQIDADALLEFSDAEKFLEKMIRVTGLGDRDWRFEDNVFVNRYGIR